MEAAERGLKNKVIIVTGGASGIGLATAKAFLAEGSAVALVDINENSLQAAAKKISTDDSKLMISVCDVSDPKAVEQTVGQTMEKFKRLDGIVNNAGLMIFKKLIDHTQEDWMKILAVDLMGAFYFTKEAFKYMTSGGTIVNVSSVHAVETTPLVASYAAAKAALLSLTRSASIEGHELGIRVNAVLPGAIDTPMLWENPNIKAGLEIINQSDVGKAEDIAQVITFLSSAQAAFIQGTSLRADGGRLSRL